jgi:hypothetical protein
MAEKQFTAKMAAVAVLEKVGEMLKKSAASKAKSDQDLKKTEIVQDFNQLTELLKGVQPHSDGHYSQVAAPEHPEAGKHPMGGKTSPVSKCPEPVHPSPANGEGNPLRRTKAQEDWQEKSEDMTKDEKIRSMQKSGYSPNQIQAELGKSDKLEKKYEGFKAVEESAKKDGASDPAAVAAAAGRKKYGKAAFQEAAASGHKMGKSELSVDFEGLESLLKGDTENSKKLGYKLSDEGKEEVAPEASDKAYQIEGKDHKSSDDPRSGSTPNPENNPKEQAEGNNELAGTTPTQVGQDGKNKPGGDEIKGHLKLAKFAGRMEYKRQLKKNQAAVASQEKVGNAQAEAGAQHSESIRNK